MDIITALLYRSENLYFMQDLPSELSSFTQLPPHFMNADDHCILHFASHSYCFHDSWLFYDRWLRLLV